MYRPVTFCYIFYFCHNDEISIIFLFKNTVKLFFIYQFFIFFVENKKMFY